MGLFLVTGSQGMKTGTLVLLRWVKITQQNHWDLNCRYYYLKSSKNCQLTIGLVFLWPETKEPIDQWV